MKLYRCKKELFLDRYDDDGRYTEESVVIKPDGSTWELDEGVERIIGDWTYVRLTQGRLWIEFTVDYLEEFFEPVEGADGL